MLPIQPRITLRPLTRSWLITGPVSATTRFPPPSIGRTRRHPRHPARPWPRHLSNEHNSDSNCQPAITTLNHETHIEIRDTLIRIENTQRIRRSIDWLSTAIWIGVVFWLCGRQQDRNDARAREIRIATHANRGRI